MYDAVVTVNDTHLAAYRKINGTLIDLRLLDPADRGSKPRLIFRPDALRKLGIPETLVAAAAESETQGLILFESLPDQMPPSESCKRRPTPEQNQQGESEQIAAFLASANSQNHKFREIGDNWCFIEETVVHWTARYPHGRRGILQHPPACVASVGLR